MRRYIGMAGLFMAMLATSGFLLPHERPENERPRPQGPGDRPTDLIARDLGVPEEVFIACFEDVQPAPRGTAPSGARQHRNKSVLLPCLQMANPGITNEKLDDVMDHYRPEGPNGR